MRKVLFALFLITKRGYGTRGVRRGTEKVGCKERSRDMEFGIEDIPDTGLEDVRFGK